MSYASSAHATLRLLQPSWYGGLFTIIGSIITIATIFIPLFYEGSWADVYFDTAKRNNTGFFSDFSRLSTAIESSDFAGDMAVFVVWALVGLALYYVLLSIAGAASGTFQFLQLITYFKADRNRLGTEAVIRLVIRLTAIVSIYGLYTFFVSDILSYVVIFTRKALFVSPYIGLLYIAFACILLIVSVHTLVILVRIMLLKYRIFRGAVDTITD
jgi:hypothetical protein